MHDAADQYGLFYEGNSIMDGIWEYLLSVTGAALICGVAGKLVSGGAAAAVVKMVTGLLMLMAVVGPWTNIRFEGNGFLEEYQLAADVSVSDGMKICNRALRERISQQVSAYILDKAKSLDATLTVEVELTDDELPVPCAVTLRGSISPYAKALLSDCIAQDLGVKKEAQIWIS